MLLARGKRHFHDAPLSEVEQYAADRLHPALAGDRIDPGPAVALASVGAKDPEFAS